MSSIPYFPTFAPINDVKLKDYSQLYSIDCQHADFTFNNLNNWLNIGDGVSLSNLNGNLVLIFDNIFDSKVKSMSLAGTHQIDQSIQTIIDYQIENKLSIGLIMVPEETVNGIQDTDRYLLKEDRDNWDYILDTHKLSDMTGNKFRTFRRKVNGFINQYKQLNVKSIEIDLTEPHNIKRLTGAMHSWNTTYSVFGNDRQRNEGLAINNGLVNAMKLDVKCLGIEIDNKLESFVIFQVHKDKSIAIANHLKCNYSYGNIFDFTTHKLAKYLEKESIELINFEQDLGIEGLRAHKMTLRPLTFYKKFTVLVK